MPLLRAMFLCFLTQGVLASSVAFLDALAVDVPLSADHSKVSGKKCCLRLYARLAIKRL
jgi:hypothetical protein